MQQFFNKQISTNDNNGIGKKERNLVQLQRSKLQMRKIFEATDPIEKLKFEEFEK